MANQSSQSSQSSTSSSSSSSSSATSVSPDLWDTSEVEEWLSEKVPEKFQEIKDWIISSKFDGEGLRSMNHNSFAPAGIGFGLIDSFLLNYRNPLFKPAESSMLLFFFFFLLLLLLL